MNEFHGVDIHNNGCSISIIDLVLNMSNEKENDEVHSLEDYGTSFDNG
jgi:cytidylate kinase